jgi:hypothetical protein
MSVYQSTVFSVSTQAIPTTTTGVIRGVVVAGSGSTGQVEFYEGSSTSGRALLWINSISNNSAPVTGLNIQFGGGVYAEVTTLDAVTLIWG